MKVNAGQSSTSMLKDVKEMGKIFLLLKIVIVDFVMI